MLTEAKKHHERCFFVTLKGALQRRHPLVLVMLLVNANNFGFPEITIKQCFKGDNHEKHDWPCRKNIFRNNFMVDACHISILTKTQTEPIRINLLVGFFIISKINYLVKRLTINCLAMNCLCSINFS